MPTEFDLEQIIHHDRELTSGYHLLVARGWRIIGEQKKLHSPLAYSAFEFRCAIERMLVELFILIKGSKKLNEGLNDISSFGRAQKTIYKLCGGQQEFERIQIFNRLYSQGVNSPKNIWIAVIDLEKLGKYWSKLSLYCHRQLEPKKTWKSTGNIWLEKGYELLNEVEEYLWSILVESHMGWVQPSTMQPEMREALKEFVSGNITQSMLATHMKLMAPIIKKRVRGYY